MIENTQNIKMRSNSAMTRKRAKMFSFVSRCCPELNCFFIICWHDANVFMKNSRLLLLQSHILGEHGLKIVQANTQLKQLMKLASFPGFFYPKGFHCPLYNRVKSNWFPSVIPGLSCLKSFNVIRKSFRNANVRILHQIKFRFMISKSNRFVLLVYLCQPQGSSFVAHDTTTLSVPLIES